MPRGQAHPTIVPAYHQLLWPTLQALKLLGNSASIQEINDRIIDVAGLADAQLQVLHGDGPMTEVAYRLHWARTYLKAVGAITNTRRGVWAISEVGQELTEAEVAAIPARVRAMARRKSPADLETTKVATDDPSSTNTLTIEVPTEQDAIASTATILTSTSAEIWQQFLLDALLAMSPASFEKLCQRILRESGFTKVDVTGRTGDGGIDGIGVLRVSLLSFHVFFQCKRYCGSVGASAIRDFRGAMVGRTDKGLFITTGTFTPDAKKEATRDGAPVLDLIDGESLCAILKDLKLGIATELVEAVTVDAAWFRAL